MKQGTTLYYSDHDYLGRFVSATSESEEGCARDGPFGQPRLSGAA